MNSRFHVHGSFIIIVCSLSARNASAGWRMSSRPRYMGGNLALPSRLRSLMLNTLVSIDTLRFAIFLSCYGRLSDQLVVMIITRRERWKHSQFNIYVGGLSRWIPSSASGTAGLRFVSGQPVTCICLWWSRDGRSGRVSGLVKHSGLLTPFVSGR